MTVLQAGAIVVTLDGDEPRCLLVTAKREPAHWLFPKGHIEQGESPAQTALREVHEEAGITGRVVEPAGSSSFQLGDKHIHVEYFLIEPLSHGDADEGRQLRWCTYDEAISQLTFPNLRALLDRAWPRVLSLHASRRGPA